jgi:Protein of unknown function (DUF1501)
MSISMLKSRREFLSRSSFGFGGLALATLLSEETPAATIAPNPLAPKRPHFPAKAKSVIFLFMEGGPSHVDTFDPKSELTRFDGQALPSSFHSEDLQLQFIQAGQAKLMGSRRQFPKRGKSGLEISDLFENVGQFADDIAVIRSCYHDSFIHGPALRLLHTGSMRVAFPSVGAWVLYGLGSESQDLPAYMMMSESNTVSDKSLFSSGFLPAEYQGTFAHSEGAALENLSRPSVISKEDQTVMLDRITAWNGIHREKRSDDPNLAARMSNYELAFRMQMAAPDLIDLSREPEHVRRMYGLDEKKTEKFGRMCLLGRRMVERGVRYVHLHRGGWDGHGECDKNHAEGAAAIDKPIAGLLGDLKQRGLLESTLVVWAGEFGRTPIMQGQNGRDHNPYGFSIWMAGGGIRGGRAIGATDEFGFRAVEDKVHVNDVHATMLALLGLDDRKLTYFYQGRDFRLTDVGGTNNLAARLTA